MRFVVTGRLGVSLLLFTCSKATKRSGSFRDFTIIREMELFLRLLWTTTNFLSLSLPLFLDV